MFGPRGSPKFPGVPRGSPEFPGVPRSSPELVVQIQLQAQKSQDFDEKIKFYGKNWISTKMLWKCVKNMKNQQNIAMTTNLCIPRLLDFPAEPVLRDFPKYESLGWWCGVGGSDVGVPKYGLWCARWRLAESAGLAKIGEGTFGTICSGLAGLAGLANSERAHFWTTGWAGWAGQKWRGAFWNDLSRPGLGWAGWAGLGLAGKADNRCHDGFLIVSYNSRLCWVFTICCLLVYCPKRAQHQPETD